MEVNLLKYLQAERAIEGHFGSTSVRESLKNERQLELNLDYQIFDVDQS